MGSFTHPPDDHDHGPYRPVEAAHRSDKAPNSRTDLGRAQARARAATRDAKSEVMTWVENNRELIAAAVAAGAGVTVADIARRITRIVSEVYSSALIPTLNRRRRLTAQRAIRSAHESLNRSVVQSVEEDHLRGDATLRRYEALIREVDERDNYALISDGTGGSLSEQVGREVAYQTAEAERLSEPRERLAVRVESVMVSGSEERPERRELGVTGHTAATRAERIAHDTIQAVHMATYLKTLLNNGVRYGTYWAVIDDRTTELCARLHGEIIDFVATPLLVPPNHWWCRSNVIPLLAVGKGREPIAESEVGSKWRTMINRWRTSDTGNYLPIDVTEEYNPSSRFSDGRYDPLPDYGPN